MNNDQLLEKIGEFIKPLVNGLAHLKTAGEALKAGQDDLQENVKTIRAEMATKVDIKRLEQKLDKTTVTQTASWWSIGADLTR